MKQCSVDEFPPGAEMMDKHAPARTGRGGVVESTQLEAVYEETASFGKPA
jgi:hypothetical protein